jgi:phage shock protein C
MTTKTPKLYRSESNRVIAGVCGGLGEYFLIDPTILRIIALALTVFGGSGLILYFILWIVIPTRSTTTKNSDDIIRENVEELKEKSKKMAGGDSKSLLGIILIVFGASLLMENLGIMAFGFLWKFWPILIVAAGLAILTKRK